MKKKELTKNFLVKSEKEIDKISYSKNPKDVFDFLSILGITCLLLGFTVFSIYIINHQGFSTFNIFILIVLIVGSVFQTSRFLSKLLKPKKNIISINNELKTVEFKNQILKTYKFSFSALNKIEYELISDLHEGIDNNKLKNQYWIELFVITTSQKRIKILNFNPRNIIDVGNKEIKKQLLQEIKPLINYMSKKLEIEARYIGVKEKK